MVGSAASVGSCKLDTPSTLTAASPWEVPTSVPPATRSTTKMRLESLPSVLMERNLDTPSVSGDTSTTTPRGAAFCSSEGGTSRTAVIPAAPSTNVYARLHFSVAFDVAALYQDVSSITTPVDPFTGVADRFLATTKGDLRSKGAKSHCPGTCSGSTDATSIREGSFPFPIRRSVPW